MSQAKLTKSDSGYSSFDGATGQRNVQGGSITIIHCQPDAELRRPKPGQMLSLAGSNKAVNFGQH
jgi:hypothetical protein